MRGDGSGARMRKIRKVVLFACTTCFAVFATSRLAREHARTHPDPPKEKKRPRATQTGRILDAIRDGATTAQEVADATRIPLERVHSLLSYHRRRGNVKGFSGKLRLAR